MNTCICCGEIIPEGRQVCPNCENVRKPKKMIPQRIETEQYIGNGKWGKGTTAYRCPRCEQFMMIYCRFCWYCGQALEREVNHV